MRLSIRKLFAGLAVAVAVLAFSAAHAADDAATVICKDGATSPGGRGACRGHGGVDKAKTKAQAPGDAKAAASAPKAAAEVPKAADKSSSDASDAMVVCKDGTSSKGGRGACRGHGGVDKSGGAKASAAPAAPAPKAATSAPAPAAAKAVPAAATTKAAPAAASADESKGTPTAKCKDGTLSYSKHHSGSCSSHGGVAEWLDKT